MKRGFLVVLLIAASIFLSGCQQILERHSKSGIQVITNDIPAAVFLDGQYLNSSPLIEEQLKPGYYTLRIEPTDQTLQPYETDVNLRKGLLTVVTWKPAERPELAGGVIYEMEKLKETGASEVSFVTIPEGAIIALEGKDKEFSPIVFSGVNPGNRSFEISLPSYETQSHTIDVQPGFRMVVRVKLAKLQAVPTEEEEALTEPAPSATPSATTQPASSATPTPASGATLLGTSSAFLDQ